MDLQLICYTISDELTCHTRMTELAVVEVADLLHNHSTCVFAQTFYLSEINECHTAITHFF